MKVIQRFLEVWEGNPLDEVRSAICYRREIHSLGSVGRFIIDNDMALKGIEKEVDGITEFEWIVNLRAMRHRLPSSSKLDMYLRIVVRMETTEEHSDGAVAVLLGVTVQRLFDCEVGEAIHAGRKSEQVESMNTDKEDKLSALLKCRNLKLFRQAIELVLKMTPEQLEKYEKGMKDKEGR